MKCEKCKREPEDQVVARLLGERVVRLCLPCRNRWTERTIDNGLLRKYHWVETEVGGLRARMQGGEHGLDGAWLDVFNRHVAATVALWNDSAAWLAEPMPAAPEAASDVIDTLGWRSCVHRINSRCNSLAERVAKLESRVND